MAFARIRSYFGSFLGRFVGLPLPVRVGTILGLAAIFGILSWRGYETYEYVQHDNDFCQSCHLMQDPFRRFEESGHRGLSCKACHQPTLIERSKMALTQFVAQPTEISHHAAVPNELCAKCHIEGDPDRWKLIAETAGHRVHLDSDRLEGLQCVKCHTAALHEFLPLDRTCAQSDCHPTVKVQLGKMANETELHCVSCHDFLADPGTRLGPRQEDCMQCHAMRERLQDFQFTDDPHGGECRACHNAHTQRTPAEAEQSCLNSGCHGDFVASPATMPAMHRGLEAASFRNCLQCHAAHTWTVQSTECQSCHTQPAAATQFAGQRFEHERHAQLACGSCHDDQNSHGQLKLASALDCMGCHHQAQTSFSSCDRCHTSTELAGQRAIDLALQLSVASAPRTRGIKFEHARHAALDCSSCHDGSALLGNDPRALSAQCTDCHADHHESTTDCARCHGPDLKGRHDRSAHVGCSGANCHTQDALTRVASMGDPCMACHADRADHEPGSDCRRCHFPAQSAP